MAVTSTIPSRLASASPALLSDRELLDTTARVAGDEQRTTAELVGLLAELDTRKLYLGEGYSSLFTYCTQHLRLSESAAYGRITAARTARRFPTVFTRLANGDVTLTTVGLLGAHLTEDNHEALLDAARHASRRDVERLVASLHPQPDIPACVRRIPGTAGPCAVGALRGADPESPLGLLGEATTTTRASTRAPELPPAPAMAAAPASAPTPVPAPVPPELAPTRSSPRPAVAPLAANRYLLRLTIGASTHAKLERASNLMRHAIPNGDPAAIVDRALTVLLNQLERRKTGRASRASHAESAARPRGRHVPAAVKRHVWARDQGRCAFEGPHGRCTETGFLEYHHVLPFASGGATDAANLELRCRAHNAYEATVHFGRRSAGPFAAPCAGAAPLFEQS